MIEEIKKEIITIKEQMLKEYKIDLTNDKIREFYYIQCLDMVLRIIEEHNNQPDYKSAFDEMFEKSHYRNITIEDMIDFSKKYNLGGE